MNKILSIYFYIYIFLKYYRGQENYTHILGHIRLIHAIIKHVPIKEREI